MLNDTQCRNAKPKVKPYKLADEKGLYLEVKPSGVKAWRYRFKLTKDGEVKESVFAIGDYASAASGESAEHAQVRRSGGRFTCFTVICIGLVTESTPSETVNSTSLRPYSPNAGE